ncbi:hypothetical protein PMN64_04875 [Bradyrhizobium sp. UFLA01-814]|uniref:hypothetical protein n=1 Tax=Bradyrhizobium sp. UFLA01-814 TaxID=3023480 RepID=UPI00398A8CFD
MAVIFAPRSSSFLGLIIQAKETSHEPRKPYAVLVIVALVCFAIVLVLWARIGTNGPASMDAKRKSPEPPEQPGRHGKCWVC